MSDTTTEQNWRVMRQDDPGNKFLVQENLSETEARRLADELEARGHKQTYWAEQMPKAVQQ